MGQVTGISWTGLTYNPWVGCEMVSAGCALCYMFRDMRRFGHDPTVVRRTSNATFFAPLKWQKQIEAGKRTGADRLVFTCSWSDFFIEEADAWRPDAWGVVHRTPDLIYQILTKRPERIPDHLPPFWNEIRDRVWLMVTAENQKCADERIPCLLGVTPRPAVFGVSYEPALQGVRFPMLDEVDWLICGGESAVPRSGARIFDLEWARWAQGQCKRAGTAFWMKQVGSNAVEFTGESITHRFNTRHPHGADPAEWPTDLRVQEFPPAFHNAPAAKEEADPCVLSL